MTCHSHTHRCRPTTRHRSLWLVAFGIFFIVIHWTFIGIALLLTGLFKLSFSKTSQTTTQAPPSGAAEAARRGLPIPDDKDVFQLLRRFEQRYRSSLASHPHLRAELEVIYEEVWHQLATSDEALPWKITLQQALNDWPITTAAHSERLKDALQRARQAAKDWQESQREAWDTGK